MNRGSGDHVIGIVKEQVASMRPRFMNRGSDDVAVVRGGIQLASMRPRFMNRGSRYARSRRHSTRRCFNEAPIHESGKLWPRGICVSSRDLASMRPRFMNRGSQGALELLRSLPGMLQ